jgi:hypothetical protein
MSIIRGDIVVWRAYQSVFMASMLLFGCAVGEHVFYGNKSDAQGITPNTPGLLSTWTGKKVSALVTERGEPDLIIKMSVNGVQLYPNAHVVSYVYSPKAEPSAGCMDAYVVDHESGQILAYHCR